MEVEHDAEADHRLMRSINNYIKYGSSLVCIRVSHLTEDVAHQLDHYDDLRCHFYHSVSLPVGAYLWFIFIALIVVGAALLLAVCEEGLPIVAIICAVGARGVVGLVPRRLLAFG